MTNLKIKDIGIFQEIANNINQVVDIAPQLMKEVNKALEDLKRDLFTNMMETKNEIKTVDAEIRELGQADKEAGQNDSQVRELRDKLNYLNIRLQDLQNSSSELDHILTQFKHINEKFTGMLSKMPNAIIKLNGIQQMAQKYLKINSTGIDLGNNQPTRQNNGNESIIINERGDTYNVKFEVGKNITEMDLNTIENKLKSSEFKGNKISIDHVRHSDFNVLQKNGYTINKNGPNDFSAFKTIKK